MREHVDPAQLDHIIAATLETCYALERHLALTAEFVGHIVGVEPDAGRHVVLVEAGYHHVARNALGNGRATIDVKQFEVMSVFPDV